MGARPHPEADYDAVSARVFGALERFDTHLATHRFLTGDTITDADLLLYVNLVRFDAVAVPLGRLNLHRAGRSTPTSGRTRDLYQRPAFGETTNLDHIKRGTFGTGAGIRTHHASSPRAPDEPTGARFTTARTRRLG